jgi:hypothetical protein
MSWRCSTVLSDVIPLRCRTSTDPRKSPNLCSGEPNRLGVTGPYLLLLLQLTVNLWSARAQRWALPLHWYIGTRHHYVNKCIVLCIVSWVVYRIMYRIMDQCIVTPLVVTWWEAGIWLVDIVNAITPLILDQLDSTSHMALLWHCLGQVWQPAIFCAY